MLTGAIWVTEEGVELRGKLRQLRGQFIGGLCSAETGLEVKTACERFAADLQQWFDDMVLFAKRQPAEKKTRKATALEVLHRVRCFWSIQAVRELGDHPSRRRLFDLRGRLKELWTLMNIQDS